MKQERGGEKAREEKEQLRDSDRAMLSSGNGCCRRRAFIIDYPGGLTLPKLSHLLYPALLSLFFLSKCPV